ncbi:hypothetical protein ACWX0K_11035 [Nitrobacteraceae bacterium UC4446_H13]
MQLIRLVCVFVIAATLAACGTQPKGSVAGGEAHALRAPPYQVKGATDYDQQWIDETTEAGVAALGWPRPKPRPAEFDRPKVAPQPAAAPPPAKKKRWFERFRRKAAS